MGLLYQVDSSWYSKAMNTPTSNAKYFFLELGVIAALYISVISFITFAFDIVNYLFPDRQSYAFDPYAGSIRFAISTLVIVFPIFVFLSRLLWKMLLIDIEGRVLAVRRWLSYLTLFVAGAAIAGDLVTLVYTFLNGEISARFVTKVAVVLIVAAAVFLYSLKDMKGLFYEKPWLFRVVMSSASAVVVAALIGGFFIIGLPASQRDLRDDQTRSGNLQSIKWDIVNHYQRTGELPYTLAQLVDPLNPHNTEYMKDPATGAAYEYKSIASSSPTFELCAVFVLDSKTDEYKGRGSYPGPAMELSSAKYASVDYYPGYGDEFPHTAGRNCFVRTIDPVRYPVTPKRL